jgi:hypothetical protein
MGICDQKNAGYEKIVQEKYGYAAVCDHWTDVVLVLKGFIHDQTAGKVASRGFVYSNGALDCRSSTLRQGQSGHEGKKLNADPIP